MNIEIFWEIIGILGVIIIAILSLVIMEVNSRLIQLENQLQQEIKKRHKIEKEFRAVFDQTFEFIGLLDLEGNLLEANKTALEFVGVNKEEVIGKPFWETPWWSHSLADKTQLKTAIQEAAKGNFVRFETIHFDQNNQKVYVDFSLKPVKDETGKIIFLVPEGRDITKIKEYQQTLEETQQEIQAIFDTLKELEASENKLQALLKHSSDIVSIFDREGLLIYNSPASQKIHGFSPEEMLGKNTFNFIHPDDRSKVGKRFSYLLKNPNETVTVQYRYQRKGDDYIWMEAVGSNQLHNPNIQGIVANSRDITQRKQSEEALRVSEEKFRQLAENIHEIFWIIDVSKNDSTYQQNIYFSPAYKEVWGYDPEELYENPLQWIEAIHPDDREGITTDFWQQVIEGKFDHEYRIIRPDGTVRWIRDRGFPVKEQSGEFIRITGLAEDITKRKQTEAEIRRLNEELAQQNHQLEQRVAQRNAELEMLFNNLPDFVFVVEKNTMKLLFCNQIFAQGIGFNQRRDVEGKTIFECFPAEVANYFAQQNEQVFNSGETLHLQERVALPEGDRYFDTYKVPLKIPQGDIYALLGTSRDMTELVKTKQILIDRTNQLEITNQELDSFCYSVSHDLRAPLRHIHGFVNALKQRLLGSDVLEDPKVIHYLEVIENSSQKMGHLIDGLLTLSRVGRRELVFDEVNLNAVVETAINLVSSRGNNIDFQVEKLPTVSGDSGLLQQVFVNLLENAIKFSRGRNPIIIKIDTLEDGTIFVSDNGVGFDMQFADKLFGAFQRLHSQKDFQGTGIGLSIVQRIINRHGGHIWAESTLGEGAIFYVKIN